MSDTCIDRGHYWQYVKYESSHRVPYLLVQCQACRASALVPMSVDESLWAMYQGQQKVERTIHTAKRTIAGYVRISKTKIKCVDNTLCTQQGHKYRIRTDLIGYDTTLCGENYPTFVEVCQQCGRRIEGDECDWPEPVQKALYVIVRGLCSRNSNQIDHDNVDLDVAQWLDSRVGLREGAGILTLPKSLDHKP